MVVFALVAGACVCVFTCAQGLLIPQGLNLNCSEQMVIIITESSRGGQSGVALSPYIARLISATWMR